MRSTNLAIATMLASAFLTSVSQAAGFGQLPVSATLGSPLFIAVPIRLEDGEVIEPECISAEVTVGDRKLAAYNVRLQVEAGPQPRDRVLRIATLTNIDEPVVSVQVTAGCVTRMVRRFSMFADPPATPPVTPMVEVAADAPSAQVQANAANQAPVAVAEAKVPAARPAPIERRVRSSAPARSEAARPAVRQARSQKAKPRSAEARAATKLAAPGPKLTLEATAPLASDAAVAAAAATASAVASALQAASAAQATASAVAARSEMLETQVQRLVAEAKQQRAENDQLRARLAAAGTNASMLNWLLALVAVLIALAAWLGWRLRQARSQVVAPQWWNAAEASKSAEEELPVPTAPPLAPSVTGAALESTASAVSSATDASAMAMASTSLPDLPLSGQEPGWTTVTPPREVSVEELIDLEQQAEFFVVLGQDESAIDLLVSHIRSSGGISPLPYLKLLEIYRRRGEVESYERTRTRFNQRFNAYAPDWDADLQHGRVLEEYPEVVAALQRVWSKPINAMAELEALLFRKDNGQLFELPAYREVLMLYSLARDLLDTQGRKVSPSVDLLLPLDSDEDDPSERHSPGPSIEDTLVLRPSAVIDRPTAPASLDVDLSRFHEDEGEVTRPGSYLDFDPNLDSRLADLPYASDFTTRRRR
jgi:hypothetical protein